MCAERLPCAYLTRCCAEEMTRQREDPMASSSAQAAPAFDNSDAIDMTLDCLIQEGEPWFTNSQGLFVLIDVALTDGSIDMEALSELTKEQKKKLLSRLNERTGASSAAKPSHKHKSKKSKHKHKHKRSSSRRERSRSNSSDRSHERSIRRSRSPARRRRRS